jgi:hypothetical protein
MRLDRYLPIRSGISGSSGRNAKQSGFEYDPFSTFYSAFLEGGAGRGREGPAVDKILLWGINPKVKIDSHSTPITRFRGFLQALLSCHSCLVINYIPKDRYAHNPKVGGSNPSPATNLFNWLHQKLPLAPNSSARVVPASGFLQPDAYCPSWPSRKYSSWSGCWRGASTPFGR